MVLKTFPAMTNSHSTMNNNSESNEAITSCKDQESAPMTMTPKAAGKSFSYYGMKTTNLHYQRMHSDEDLQGGSTAVDGHTIAPQANALPSKSGVTSTSHDDSTTSKTPKKASSTKSAPATKLLKDVPTHSGSEDVEKRAHSIASPYSSPALVHDRLMEKIKLKTKTAGYPHDIPRYQAKSSKLKPSSPVDGAQESPKSANDGIEAREHEHHTTTCMDCKQNISNTSKTKHKEAFCYGGTILEAFNEESTSMYNKAAGRAHLDQFSASRTEQADFGHTKDETSSKSVSSSKASPTKKSCSSNIDNSLHLAVAKEVDPSLDIEPIYEASHYEPEPKQPHYKNRRCQLLTIFFLLMIAAAIALAVVYPTKKTREGKKLIVPAPRTRSREDFITKTLKSQVNHVDANDPRWQAFHWILRNDDLTLDLNDANRLKQRYALALLAFQFDSQAWYLCGADFTSEQSCLVESTENETDLYMKWLSSTDECEWYGISCVDGTVREIDLRENQLIGEMPPDIAMLEHLEALDLSRNCIIGTVASEVGTLTKMKHLNLDNNGLGGTLPEELFNLNALTYLNLARQGRNTRVCTSSDGTSVDIFYGPDGKKNMGIIGQVFDKITSLEKLRWLLLNWNDFTGQITSNISNLKQLEVLSVSDNTFTGTLPNEVSELTRLRELGIAWTEISGPIPKSIGKMKSLEVLNVAAAELNGTLPMSIYELPNLRKLYLDRNDFQGTIDASVGNLKELREFSVWSNQFTGTIPSELAKCENIETIYIQDNEFSGTIPNELKGLRDKHLYDPPAEYLRADCLHPSSADAPFVRCDFCDYCCNSMTKWCLNMQYDVYDLNETST